MRVLRLHMTGHMCRSFREDGQGGPHYSMQVTYKGELEKPSEEQDKSIPDRRKIRKGPVVEKSTGEFHVAGG